MEKVQIIFSNREIATIFWLVVVIILFQFSLSWRMATYSLVKAFFRPAILTILCIAIFYSIGVFYFLQIINPWNKFLLKDAIFWFAGSGFIILMNLTKAGKEAGFFKRILIDNLKLILILEFIINFSSFSLVVELIILPLITFLAMIEVLADQEERYRVIKNGVGWILAIIGISLFVISVRSIYIEINEFATSSTISSFLLPILLSIFFIPCAYFIALYMNYQVLFKRLRTYLTNKKDLRYAKWRIFRKCHFYLKKLCLVTPRISKLYSKSTREEIREIIS